VTGFVGRLLIKSPNYTAATATACMVIFSSIVYTSSEAAS